MRIAIDHIRQQADFFHHRAHFVHHLIFAQLRIKRFQRLGNDVTDGHTRIERGQRVLENHLNVFAF